MPTKKDLEQQFEISDNTVYKTLKACGLDTGKEKYTEEEIENYFKVARQMLDAGKRYKDVEQYFGLADAEPEEANQQPNQQDRTNQGTAADAVGMATAEMAVDMVQDAVKQITPHIPQLVAHTLAQEMQSPEMRSAFEDMRSVMKQKKSTNNNAGVDFLLKRINNNGAKQITGNSNTQALPQASLEESGENFNE